MTFERLVGAAIFSQRRNFGQDELQPPLYLLILKCREEEVPRLGAYLDEPSAVDLTLSFNFDFIYVLDLDVDEALSGEEGTRDVSPL